MDSLAEGEPAEDGAEDRLVMMKGEVKDIGLG